MTILVSQTAFPNDSYFDPQSTDCEIRATLTFQSTQAGALTCFTSIDDKVGAVFEGQDSDGRFTATTAGSAQTLLGSIGSGTTIVISVQGSVGKGTNGHINVGTGSGDSFQHTR